MVFGVVDVVEKCKQTIEIEEFVKIMEIKVNAIINRHYTVYIFCFAQLHQNQ